MIDTALATDFAIFTYHAKGIVLSSVLLGDRLPPTVRNDWKLMYKKLVTDASNFEKEMNKALGPKGTDQVEDMDAVLFSLIQKIMHMDGKDLQDFMIYLNEWKEE